MEDVSGCIQLLREYNVILCVSCKHAVWPHEIEAHFLGTKHKYAGEAARRIAAISDKWMDCISDAKRLCIPSNPIDYIPQLQRHGDGMRCKLCLPEARSNACNFLSNPAAAMP